MSSHHIKWGASINILCDPDKAEMERSKVSALAINQMIGSLQRIRDPRHDPDVAHLINDGPRLLSGYYRVKVNTCTNASGIVIADHLNIRVIFRLLVIKPIGSDAHVYQLYENDLVPDGGENTRTIEIVSMAHRSEAYDSEVVRRVNLIGRYPRPPKDF